MTLSTTVSSVVCRGNGSTSAFNYNFIIPTLNDAVVTLTDASGNVTTLANTSFAISGLGNPNGGTVIYPLSGAPIASGVSLTITRQVPYQQLTSLSNQSGYYPAVVEAALDNLEMQIQQVANLAASAGFTGTLTTPLNLAHPWLAPNSTTVDLSLATSNLVFIDNSTPISSFGSLPGGAWFIIVFGMPCVVESNASIYLPGGGNINAQTYDSMIVISTGLGTWLCVSYQPYAGYGTGGGGSSSPVITSIPSFTWTNASVTGTPGTYSTTNYQATNPGTFLSSPGKFSLSFDFTSTGYFAANPIAHFAVAVRHNNSITTSNDGHGGCIGNASGVTDMAGDAASSNPTMFLETWYGPGESSANNCWMNAEDQYGVFQDGQTYRVKFDSTRANDGSMYIRGRAWIQLTEVGVPTWQLVIDTGDVLDGNPYASFLQSGVLFAMVFGSNLTSWSLSFFNITATWGPDNSISTDASTKFSRYGGLLKGPINWAFPVAIAAASTMAIGAAASNAIWVTGVATITAFDSIQNGAERVLMFASAGSVLVNSSTLVLPGGANITVGADDSIRFMSAGAGAWVCTGYQPIGGSYPSSSVTAAAIDSALGYTPVNPATAALTGTPTAPTAAASTSTTQIATTAFAHALAALYLPLAGGTLSGAMNWAFPAVIAAASTMAIGAAGSNAIWVTGTGTITAFDSIPAPAERMLVFQNTGCVVQNSASLELPGGANITMTAGDVLVMCSSNSGNWFCKSYQPIAGYSPKALTSSQVTTALGYTPASTSSPAFTGVPTAPTAAGGTNNTQIATTAFATALAAAYLPLTGGYLSGASSKIGQVSGNFATRSGFADYNAVAWTTGSGLTAANVAWYCTAGNLTSYLQGQGFSNALASAIEVTVRPVYCIVSVLMQEIFNREIF